RRPHDPSRVLRCLPREVIERPDRPLDKPQAIENRNRSVDDDASRELLRFDESIAILAEHVDETERGGALARYRVTGEHDLLRDVQRQRPRRPEDAAVEREQASLDL